MVLNKKGFGSFGNIVATIGSILIAVGIAWLLADNWHAISSFFKIFILLTITSGCFFIGTLLKIKKFPKIASTLTFLGSAIFTLSIFLIAQIFHLSNGLQTNATLILLSIVGVFLAAYIQNSSSSALLGLVELFFFILIQFLAFIKNTEFSPAFIALIFLSLGVLIYGITLIHEKIKHSFSNLYKIFSVAYFLLFAYILTFESLLPNLWTKGFELNASAFIFIIILLILALISISYGIRSVFNTSKRSIMFFALIISILTFMIFLAYFVLSDVGSCTPKYCSSFEDATTCTNSKLGNECVWKDNYCQDKTCFIYNKLNCEGQIVNGKSCVWNEYSCTEDDCYLYNNENECNIASKKLNNTCQWKTEMGNGYCNKIFDKNIEKNVFDLRYEKCNNITTKDSCNIENLCTWGPYTNYYGRFNGRNEPVKVIVLWILNNIIFLGVIILFIFYATLEKNKIMINIGIIFFALDIFSRYIGFIMDYAGYLSLSIFFITGGVILVFGGYFIEVWRRKLIAKTSVKTGGRK